jgi:hypothetical protein
MKAIVTRGPPVTVLDRPDTAGTPIGTVTEGDVVSLSPSVVGEEWVVIPRGQRNGFIQGLSRLQVVTQLVLVDRMALALAEPHRGAEVSIRLKAGQMLYLVERVPGDGGDWLHIRSGPIGDGYLPPIVRVRERTESASAQRADSDLLYGSLLLVGGLALTIGTYFFTFNGGFYFFAGGPIIFGVYRLFRGLTLRLKG